MVKHSSNTLVLPPNREVLEDFARTYPDILVDMIKDESMYDDGWCVLAIEVVNDVLTDSVSLPLLRCMGAHPSPSIREVVFKLLADRQMIQEILELAYWTPPQASRFAD